MALSKIQKRDGRIVPFEPKKIEIAISKAMNAVGQGDEGLARKITQEIIRKAKEKFQKRIPHVEDIQDLVEEALIASGLAKTAKAYILYREERSRLRQAKQIFGVRDDLKLSLNAMKVLERRYLLRDTKGAVIETPREMFRRVAKAVAAPEKKYGGNQRKSEDEFYQAMSNLEFVPNTPTLMNAGTPLGQLSACFVIPVEDSLVSIFDAVKHMAIIHQSGGGTGFSFSRLRPRGDTVKSTRGVASGPVSFMRVFDTATDVIKQGGKRRGANMGILSVDHPDIVEFITAKTKEGFLSNFNISVGVTDAFMRAVEGGRTYPLISPRTKKKVRDMGARDVWDLIITTAWTTGDPGVVFLDEINRRNPTQKLGRIESTNPCGEVPLHPWESCNLGSINLAKLVEGGRLDWARFEELIKLGVRFLDNVIDANHYPLAEIERTTRSNRRIGLGIMGWAEALIQLGIPYDSPRAIALADKVMSFIDRVGTQTSVELGKQRGSFPNFRKSVWSKKYKSMRNATVTTIAPTGTISIIAGCSSGIEPLFAVSFIRNVMEGTQLLEVNPYFETVAKQRKFWSRELMAKIAKRGSVKGMREVPRDVQKLFVTALDTAPLVHVKMQAVFQKYTHNAVSKTINLPNDATVDDVERAYLLAYKLKCKGITVYRYGSKGGQVLYIGPLMGREAGEQLEYVSADSDFAGGCPLPICPH